MKFGKRIKALRSRKINNVFRSFIIRYSINISPKAFNHRLLFRVPFHDFVYAHSWLFVLLVEMSLESVPGIYSKPTIFAIIDVIKMFGFNVTS